MNGNKKPIKRDDIYRHIVIGIYLGTNYFCMILFTQVDIRKRIRRAMFFIHYSFTFHQIKV